MHLTRYSRRSAPAQSQSRAQRPRPE
jgi:hypothetical protein